MPTASAAVNRAYSALYGMKIKQVYPFPGTAQHADTMKAVRCVVSWTSPE